MQQACSGGHSFLDSAMHQWRDAVQSQLECPAVNEMSLNPAGPEGKPEMTKHLLPDSSQSESRIDKKCGAALL